MDEERVKCALADCGEFHAVVPDKNGRSRITCPQWNVTVWFDRGPKGREYLQKMRTSPTCPGCGGPVDWEGDWQCPKCGEPWSPCPDCNAVAVDGWYCLRCGNNVDDALRSLEEAHAKLLRKQFPWLYEATGDAK